MTSFAFQNDILDGAATNLGLLGCSQSSSQQEIVFTDDSEFSFSHGEGHLSKNSRRLASPQTSLKSCHLDVIDQRNISAPDDTYSYEATGKGVNIYFFNCCGSRLTHQDFGGRASCGFDAGILGFGIFGSNCSPSNNQTTAMMVRL